MTQRIAYMAAAAMAAFMVVLLAALGAYIVLHGQDAAAVGTAADNNTSALTAPSQNTTPQMRRDQEQPEANDLILGAIRVMQRRIPGICRPGLRHSSQQCARDITPSATPTGRLPG